MADTHFGKNIFWVISSRFGTQIIAVISNLLLARYLGSGGFGEYAFISAVVLIGNALSTFGTDMVLIRNIASTNDYSDLPAALVIQLSISLFFIIGLLIFAPFLPAENSLRIYIFSLVPLSFFTIFTIALRGARYMGSFSLLHFMVAVFQMVSVFILLYLNSELELLAVLLLGVQVLGALLGFGLCISQIKDFSRRWHLDWKKIPLLLTSSAQMAVIGTLRLIYEKLAVTTLPILAGVDVTGLFSASARVLDSSKLAHMSALSAMFPEMARENTLENGFSAATKRNRVLLFAAAILLSLVLFLLAEPIVLFLFGKEYALSVGALQIMAWGVIPYFGVTYYSLAFVAVRFEKPVLISLSISLFLLATLLIWWTPLLGLRGAALSILCTETFQATALWFQWRWYAFSKQP